MIDMRSLSRIQDEIVIVLGAYTALSPIWLQTDSAARWSLIVIGLLIAISGLAHMARPEVVWAEYGMAALGLLMFISPWVMSYNTMAGPSWTARIVGLLTIAVAVTGLPVTNSLTNGRGGVAAHRR